MLTHWRQDLDKYRLLFEVLHGAAAAKEFRERNKLFPAPSTMTASRKAVRNRGKTKL